MKIFQTIFIALCVLTAACGSAKSGASPAETLQKFIEASKNKDVQATKSLLSKSTLATIEKSAAAQNTTIDAILLNDSGTPLKEIPETRGEKIEGDAATLEVKNRATGEFEAIPFVKEDGIWKIALDKFMQNMLEKVKQKSNAPPPAVEIKQPPEQSANKNRQNF